MFPVWCSGCVGVRVFTFVREGERWRRCLPASSSFSPTRRRRQIRSAEVSPNSRDRFHDRPRQIKREGEGWGEWQRKELSNRFRYLVVYWAGFYLSWVTFTWSLLKEKLFIRIL